MSVFKNILLTTDFSEHANAGIPYAVALVKHSGGTLHILHVFESSGSGALLAGVVVDASAWLADLRAKFESRLEMLARDMELEHGIKVVTKVVPGHPVHEIVDYIKSSGVDLTVVATHGHSAIAHLVLGSTAERVVRLSPKPVLTVRPRATQRPEAFTFKRILLPTDFSANSEAIWPQALALATQYNAALLLVHVIEPSVYYANATMSEGMGVDVEQWLVSIRRNADEQLRKAAEKLKTLTTQPVQTLLREGRAADEIVAAAESQAADLMVISTHGYTGVAHVIFGSVAERIVRLSSVAVISIKP